MTAQELEQTRSAWDEIAAGYDEFVTPSHAAPGRGCASPRRPPSGHAIPGRRGRQRCPQPPRGAARRTGAFDGRVSPHARAARGAREERLDLETRVMDGHEL